jgi:hypothetical protein
VDKPDHFIRVLLLKYSKPFDLINQNILIDKLIAMDVSPNKVRWMAAFLLDRTQRVKIGNCLSGTGSPNGGVPQGTLSGPKNFLIQINDLRTPCDIIKCVNDNTMFEICSKSSISVIQQSADIACKRPKDNDMRINTIKQRKCLYVLVKTLIISLLFQIL